MTRRPAALAAASSRSRSATEWMLVNTSACGVAAPKRVPSNGRRGSLPPKPAPISRARPHSAAAATSTPRRARPAPSGRQPRRGQNTQSAAPATPAHSTMTRRSGRMRSAIQTATPRKSTPKTCLTVSIQAPARGRSLPAEAPTTSKGAPMPMDRENKARPPRSTLPVWLMTASAATSGGATQAVTTSEDSAPIRAVDSTLPPESLPLTPFKRVCNPAGNCSS